MPNARFLLRFVLAAAIPAVLKAAEPAGRTGEAEAAPPAVANTATAPTGEAKRAAPADVVTLPKVEVTASRLRELDRAIRRLDKQMAREKKQMKSSEVDRAINSQKLANAAAIFGGNSSEHLALVAAQRVGLMETEREILVDMKQPRSREELALYERELNKLRTLRRELDNPGR